MNSKKIIALGVSAVGAAALTFSTIGPASAVVATPSTLTEAVCAVLPASVTTLASQLLAATGLIGTTQTDLTVKQSALLASITDLVPAVVAHINAVSTGASSVGTGQVLAGKSSIFAEKVVAANDAMTANFEAQRSAYLTNLNSGYVTGVVGGLCI